MMMKIIMQAVRVMVCVVVSDAVFVNFAKREKNNCKDEEDEDEDDE